MDFDFATLESELDTLRLQAGAALLSAMPAVTRYLQHALVVENARRVADEEVDDLEEDLVSPDAIEHYETAALLCNGIEILDPDNDEDEVARAALEVLLHDVLSELES